MVFISGLNNPQGSSPDHSAGSNEARSGRKVSRDPSKPDHQDELTSHTPACQGPLPVPYHPFPDHAAV